MDLLEAMTAASEADPEAEASSEEAAEYSADLAYQEQLFAIEQSLRDIGVLPQPETAREPKPFDAQLRKLIQSVPVE